jgi:hypothetical protein
VIKQRGCLAALLLLAACGRPQPSVEPVRSASGAVQSFMQAVADSNLARMAALWGTPSGPASKTGQPNDYERRIVIMQAYLRNEGYRITSDVPQSPERRHLQVELRRQTCTWSVPFVAIKAPDGTWLVNQIDLTAAGNPARRCEQSDSTGRG